MSLSGVFGRLFGVKPTEEPHCYICAKAGHTRVMHLVAGPTVINRARWDKPWSPTQSCYQCGNCGRLACYTHTDSRITCDCGAQNWITKSYWQSELDDGEAEAERHLSSSNTTGLYRQGDPESDYYVRIVIHTGNIGIQKAIHASEYRAQGYKPPIEELPWRNA
jgi:hypothetical protein